MRDQTHYQYCQKIVVLRNNDQEVLLARRQGEQDYNQTYTFIGGKLETTDGDILSGLLREKNEEIGPQAQISMNPLFSYNAYFVKKDGNHVILPHYYATYISGDIKLSDEYDDYKWVALTELDEVKPKVDNIPLIIDKLLAIKAGFDQGDFVTI